MKDLVETAAKLAEAQLEAHEAYRNSPEELPCAICQRLGKKEAMLGVKAIDAKNNFLDEGTLWIHRECLEVCEPQGTIYDSPNSKPKSS